MKVVQSGAAQVAFMGEIRNACEVLVEKLNLEDFG